jgi:hypothetical protein
MAIQINTALNTPDGGTVGSGSVAMAQIIFVPPKIVNAAIVREVHFNIKVYRSQQAYVDQKPHIRISDFPAGYEKIMTDEEFLSLETDNGALSKVEGWLKTYIESKIGVDTCEITSLKLK